MEGLRLAEKYYICIYCQKRLDTDQQADNHIENPGKWCKFLEWFYKKMGW